jgi:hypothetical protein
MSDPLASALAHRLARVLGLSALALPALASAACGGNVFVDGSGAGGASSTGTGGGAGGSLPACIAQAACTPIGPPGPSNLVCFTPAAGETCPEPSQASSSLMVGCAEIISVQAACSGGPVGSCCYNVTIECACVGRPLVVDGAPRTAKALRGDGRGWQRSAAFEVTDVSDVPPATRQALAAAFAEDALGEHASVASFGRFALELLALGAPAELVAGAHRAALDEVRHAQIAFGLASAFLGSPLGPGALACDALALRTDLASFAQALAVEGCVGETLAALVAAARAEAATDGRVAGALASIAEDEARHAELAWRTMAWVLRVGGDEVRRIAFAALADGAAGVLAAPRPATRFVDLRSFGVLAAGEVGERLAAGVAAVVEPCARSLRDAVPATLGEKRG